jgi:GR25 family glycosyltransferase involved in LPS biosynthesis
MPNLAFKCIVINLARRTDRLQSFIARAKQAQPASRIERFQAVDGRTLSLTPEIQQLFRNNDFEYRAGTIGCALSHYRIWQALLQQPAAHGYLVFEDDVLFSNDFAQRWPEILRSLPFDAQGSLDFDLLYLGGMLCGRQLNPYLGLALNGFGHGTFSYFITQRGARTLLREVERTGIERALDWFMIGLFPKMTVLTTIEPLCGSRVDYDSDVQTDSQSLSSGQLENPRHSHSALSFRQKPEGSLRVKLLGNWGSPAEILTQWDKMSEGGGRWQRLQLTLDERDLDFVVVINACEPRYLGPRTLYFRMEPEEGRKLWGPWKDPDPSRFLKVYSHAEHFNHVEWHLSLSYRELLAHSPVKDKQLSSVTSSAYTLSGHKKRVDFLRYLEEQGLEFDLFGKSNAHALRSYRGSLPVFHKDAGLFPYRYTIACENCSEAGYATEKLWDAILSECLCFYWGCPNVDSFIPKEAYVWIDLNDFAASKRIIEESMQQSVWEQRIELIRETKRKILNELSFFPRLEKLLWEQVRELGLE